MKGLLHHIKKTFSRETIEPEDAEEEYVEVDTVGTADVNKKYVVRPFTLDDFSDLKPILDALREGHTICFINISPLKEKDQVELRRALTKLKKTVDAISGDIAGFSDNYIVATPPFAEIYRSKATTQVE
jgi:SepF-like predicted cell division protein (DUF552 family)